MFGPKSTPCCTDALQSVPKLRAQAKEWGYHKNKVQKDRSFSFDGPSPQASSQSSGTTTCVDPSPSSSTDGSPQWNMPESFHIEDIYRVHKRKRSSSSGRSDEGPKHPKASVSLRRLF